MIQLFLVKRAWVGNERPTKAVERRAQCMGIRSSQHLELLLRAYDCPKGKGTRADFMAALADN